jgi:putative intracellular protease/amidase
MTETVYVAVYDTLADWEYGYLAARVNSPALQSDPDRFRVRTASHDGLAVTTMGGVRIDPDVALESVEAEGTALFVLPGADAWTEGESLQPFARAAADLLEANVPVAAICGAVVGLAREGVLDRRTHTGNSRAELDSTHYAGGEHFRDTDAVTDRGLITASAREPVAFAREAFRLLDVFPPEVIDQWSGLFGRRPA